jgi:protein SCO1/2
LSSTTTSTTPERPRTRRTKEAAILGAVLVVALFVVAVVVGQRSSASPKPPGENVGAQLNDQIPDNIASLPLVDEHGNDVNLASFQGKIVVMTDFLTTCQEICPITTAVLNQVDQAVTKAGLADKVQFVDVTVDPGRDDPARLHAYRDFAKLLPNWTLLTGTQQNLDTLFKYFGISYEKTAEAADGPPAIDWLTGKPLTYDVSHSDVLIFLDQQGKQRFVMQGAPLGSNAPLTSGEREFLNDEGHENLANAADGSWTGDQALQVVSWLTKKHISADD